MRGFDWDSKGLLFMSTKFIGGRDRRAGFEEYLREYAGDYAEVDYYLRNGSWRDAPVEHTAATRQRVNASDNECYYNAQTGLAPGLTYWEGYAVSDDGAIAHAWLETDDFIVETSPTLLRMDVDYYGVSFNDQTVRSAMTERGTAEPVVERAVR